MRKLFGGINIFSRVYIGGAQGTEEYHMRVLGLWWGGQTYNTLLCIVRQGMSYLFWVTQNKCYVLWDSVCGSKGILVKYILTLKS